MQAGNYVTEVTPSISSFSYSNIGAGTVPAPASVSNGSTTFKFTSGFTSTTAPSSIYGSLSESNSFVLSETLGGFVSVNSSSGQLRATNRGVTIGNARTSGAVVLTREAIWTPTTSYNSGGTKSGTATATASCVQAGNYITSISVSSSNRTLTYGQAAASGGTLTPTKGGYLDTTFTFSSGFTSTTLPGSIYGSLATTSTSFSGSASGTFGAPNSSTGAVIVSSKGTTTSEVTSGSAVTMSETVTWTPTSSYNSAGTKTATATTKGTPTQEANTATTSTVYDGTITVSISASAGTSSSSPLSAGGGTSTLSYSASQAGRTKYVWTSGDTSYSSYNTSTSRTPSVTGSATGFSLSGTTVTAADRGTTTGDVRSVTYTASYGDVSKSVTIYQQANVANASSAITAYGVPTVTVSNSFTAGGGSATFSATVSNTVQYYYTSGAAGSTGTVAGSIGEHNISTQFFSTSSSATSGSTLSRFTNSGWTVTHSSMAKNTGYDVIRYFARNAGDTSKVGYSSYIRVQNSYSDSGGTTTYGSWSGGAVSFSKSTLGAGADSATVYVAPWSRSSSTSATVRTWTSGSSETVTAASTGTDYYTGSVAVSVSGSVVSLSATSFTASSGTNRSITISKSSYGTTEVSATSATVTANPTGSGPGTTTGAISIEANKVESDPCYVTVTSFSYSNTPWGDTTSSSPTFAGRFVGGDVTYTSGSTITRASQNFTSQTSAIMLSFAESSPTSSSASVNSSTGIISWGGSNTSTSRASVGVTMTLSYQYGKAYTTTASTVAYHDTGYKPWEMLEFNCSTVTPIPVTEEAYFTTEWRRSTPSGYEYQTIDCSPASFYNNGSYGSGYRIYVQYVSPSGSITGGEYVDVDS